MDIVYTTLLKNSVIGHDNLLCLDPARRALPDRDEERDRLLKVSKLHPAPVVCFVTDTENVDSRPVDSLEDSAGERWWDRSTA